MLSDKNLDVLTNIISAVESGGQVYGKRRYDTYADPYHISQSEHTITIGWACNNGAHAKELMQKIYDYDPKSFKRLDGAGIEQKLKESWNDWFPTSAQKAAILRLITSESGKKAQDDLFKEDMQRFITDCEKKYTSDPRAVMMYCEIRHLGGGAVDRIFKRAKSYSIEDIMASLVKDQSDTSSSNQVGDKKYWSRHVKCAEFIQTYAETEKKETKMTSKDVTICGHGSGRPSLKNLYSYSSQRYNQKAPNGVRKGIVCVRRLKAMDGLGRERFVKYYNTIIGRNYYSQNLRQYVYEPYKGKYYSDCSSSGMATYKKCGYEVFLLNTAGIYESKLFENVPVEIVKGQIQNPEVLKIGDAILYAGSDPSRPKQIGHVEFVHSFGKAPEEKDNVKDFQNFLNKNYPDIVTACSEGLLEVDGAYGPKTRSGALGVWKYMSNKYYGTNLTIGNDNFFGACTQAARNMTETEVKRHPTLAFILQGILSGKKYYDGQFDAVVGSGTKNAIKEMTGSTAIDSNMWHTLFN